MSSSRFWDIIVVRQDGEWVGFRTPFKSLRRTAGFFGLIIVIALVATTGWLLSRWKAHRYAMQLSSEQLRANSLELQLNDFRNRASVTQVPLSTGDTASPSALQSFSLLPSLDSDPLHSLFVEFSEASAEYDAPEQELSIKFELLRKPPVEQAMQFYWIAMLHGPQGILFLPANMASRKGEPIMFHRGQSLEDVKTRRAVNARLKVSDFVERAASEAMFVTLLIYDNKGALVLRNRLDLFMRRARQKGSKE